MIAPVVRLRELKPHPNADKLQIARLSNDIEIVVGLHYKENILGVYIPVDRLLPGYLSEDLWLMGRATAMQGWFVVRTIILRGVPSPGLFSGSVYRKDTSDHRSVERFQKLTEGGGKPRSDGWINWPYWRQGWKEGDDVGTYLGIRLA